MTTTGALQVGERCRRSLQCLALRGTTGPRLCMQYSDVKQAKIDSDKRYAALSTRRGDMRGARPGRDTGGAMQLSKGNLSISK